MNQQERAFIERLDRINDKLEKIIVRDVKNNRYTKKELEEVCKTPDIWPKVRRYIKHYDIGLYEKAKRYHRIRKIVQPSLYQN